MDGGEDEQTRTRRLGRAYINVLADKTSKLALVVDGAMLLASSMQDWMDRYRDFRLSSVRLFCLYRPVIVDSDSDFSIRALHQEHLRKTLGRALMHELKRYKH